jgi:hypothetical protein
MKKWITVNQLNDKNQNLKFGKWKFDSNEILLEESLTTGGLKQMSDGIVLGALLSKRTQSLPFNQKK